MKTYLISPQAPLMFRDGRNFSADASVAETLAFPRPSTLAGAIRTAWAESQKNFDYPQQALALLNENVQGPLLVEMNSNENKALFPAPADALCLQDNQGEKQICRLKPGKTTAATEGTDLPHDELMPVFLTSDNKQKPAKNAPAYWYTDQFLEWLADDDTPPHPAKNCGVPALPVEIRTHVAIDPETQSNKTAYLFQTAGIDFSQRQQQNETDIAYKTNQYGWQAARYGLLLRFSKDIPDTLRTIGGEARLGKINKTENDWPQPSEKLIAALTNAKHFRLHLITPAIFANGYLPDFIDVKTLHGTIESCQLDVTLRAAAIPRWQAGTSWDMLAGQRGKGMRKVQRLVPAGAVYWFEINNGDAKNLINLWLTSISDERKNDGYGLVVPGIWKK